MRAPRRRSIVVAKLEADRGDSAQAAILAELRRCLLDGVPPGSAIPLDEVAAVFGVSRIPVREALKTLIGEGLVEHRPNFGYTVAKLTPGELHELYVVRGVLEAAALGAAVSRARPAHDEQARAAHAALADALAAGDVRAYHRESRRFHLALVSPSGMKRLLDMFESAWNLTEPLQPMAHVREAERVALHADHEGMLAAFVARDATTLVEAARTHHDRLRSSLAAVPRDTGLFADGEDIRFP
ncbi:GntR family transcriptional regulator [Lentzea sp. NPDC092896]|uniref:GntR family transcriptional regulator n=1 Tax=Lentzea sp. NPDC092896 TaxID=3364127 RepID=UPI0038157EC0